MGFWATRPYVGRGGHFACPGTFTQASIQAKSENPVDLSAGSCAWAQGDHRPGLSNLSFGEFRASEDLGHAILGHVSL